MLEALREPRRALALAGAYRPLAERALADAPLDAGRRARRAARAGRRAGRRCCGPPTPFAARHFGRRVKLCVLNNARSGLCPEDCGYCSQSAVSTADIARYRLKPVTELVAAARQAAAAGAPALLHGDQRTRSEPGRRRALRAAPRGRSARSSRTSSCACRSASWATTQARGAARRGRRLREPQPEHEPPPLPRDLHDAHLRRPRRHGAQRARGRPGGVLGRDRRHGRDATTIWSTWRERSPRSRVRVAAGELPAPDRRHAARRAGAARGRTLPARAGALPSHEPARRDPRRRRTRALPRRGAGAGAVRRELGLRGRLPHHRRAGARDAAPQ